MDFFSAATTNGAPCAPVDQFADAINSRFGSAPLLTARLVPEPVPPLPRPLRLPSSPMANMSLAASRPPPPTSSASFTPVVPHALPSWLADPATLVVDIRPHAAYSAARIPPALSLSVPSTLLKRPLFSLQKLSAMLPSHTARSRFAEWRNASRIVVYDTDAAAIPDSSNILGLLRKFKAEGFQGQLAWIQGGFQAVWRERRDLVDTDPPSPEADADDDDEKPAQAQPVLRTTHLPMAAFSLSSTTASGPAKAPSSSRLAMPVPVARPAFNPFFDTVRQNVELSHGITERIPLRLPRRVRRRIHDLPFPWLQDIARRSAPQAVSGNPLGSSSSDDDDVSEDEANTADVDEGTETLAMQFYRIELAEQRRLMGVMEHHSKESCQTSSDCRPFPFSITAGVEKGAKNRYRHIWPFEHARVRLHAKRDSDDDDYVNASYVQPLGTTKRYIATQGPLPATFTDFWSLCWEQNVHVIVMLTREVEGAMVKCGSYWTDEAYGPLRLRLVSTTGAPEQEPDRGFFAPPREPTAPPKKHRVGSTIKRVFALEHTHYPAAGARRIVHLQYLEWPDMNVPDDPRGVLGLIREVEDAVAETADPVASDESSLPSGDSVDPTTGIALNALGRPGPVLLHCSAGVGRTGGFIAVDAVLDAVRREVRAQLAACASPTRTTAMDVDADAATVVPRSSVLGTGEGLLFALPVTAGQSTSTSRPDARGEGMSVHVPLAGWGPADAPGVRTPMQVDSSTDTRRWAQTVRDETQNAEITPPSSALSPRMPDAPRSIPLGPGAGATAPRSASPMSTSPSSASPATSLSDDSFGFSRTHSSSVSTSLSQHSLPAKDSVALPGPAEPHDEPRHAADHERTRTFSAPAGRRLLSASPSPSPLAQNPYTYSAPTSLSPRARSPAGAATVDYKAPRALHARGTPPPLSALDAPIWEVVQDMREQRMSLCQSLRQYVFVHAAVVEGALAVVDAERAAAGRGRGRRAERGGSPGSASSASTGKRMASPTELVKEARAGGAQLAKRPSVKRERAGRGEDVFRSAREHYPP